MAASKAFRESFTQSLPLEVNADFNTLDARRLRYQVFWSMYENSAYRNVHKWAQQYRTIYGLYRFIRNIYNPAYRLGEFWQSHLWSGPLDLEAGDGNSKPSAIPIVTDNERLRPAIGKLWAWSNWQQKKGIVTLHGAVLGDAVIKIVDDTVRGKVYLEPVHPGSLAGVDLDKWGNVKGYTVEEERKNERGNTIIYREVATREGDSVIYRTYRDNELFAWDGDSAEWAVPYGFVPMVVIQHKDVGLPWGWSELQAGMSNFREVDDQASLLNDQIRKTVNPPWLFAGVGGVKGTTPGAATNPGSDDDPEAAREAMNALYGPVGSDAKPLVAPLDISGVASNISEIIKKIERDYPELSESLENAAGDVSGRALRINRQPVIDKVNERRTGYDSALVRAHQMAVAIGGWRGYDSAFQPFDLDSYRAGELDHQIKDREVFAKDPLDDAEIEQAFWNAASAAKAAGVPLRVFLKRQGWTEEAIGEIVNDPENVARVQAVQASARALSGQEEARPPFLNRQEDELEQVNGGEQ